MKVTTYRDLDVWKAGMELAEKLHPLLKQFPKDEMYALTSQMRRGSYSIPSNIAEGFGREHTQEYIQFLSVAKGSLTELETQMILAVKFAYLTKEDRAMLWDLRQRIGMMLTKLKASLARNIKSGSRR